MSYRLGLDRARYDSGTAFPALPQAGDAFYRTDLNEAFYYDASRSKWLGFDLECAEFAYLAGLTNGLSYIDAAQCVLNSYGYSYPYDMRIVGIRVNIYSASTTTWAPFVGTTQGPTVSTSSSKQASATNWDTACAAGSILTLYCLGTATGAHNAQLLLRRHAT